MELNEFSIFSLSNSDVIKMEHHDGSRRYIISVIVLVCLLLNTPWFTNVFGKFNFFYCITETVKLKNVQQFLPS